MKKQLKFRFGLALLISFLFLSKSVTASCDMPSILSGTILTMNSRDDVYQGDVLICNGLIRELKKQHLSWKTDFNVSQLKHFRTDGVILPGLINLHDHTKYNYFQLWEPPKKYENRYQWQRARLYKKEVKSIHRLMTSSDYHNLSYEVAMWDEVKSVVGGTTSIQGTSRNNVLNNWLVRNVDHKNFGQDKVYSRVLSVKDQRFDSQELISKAEKGKVDAFFIHLAEGVDKSSKNEYNVLKERNLLQPWTVIVHGTALGQKEFEEMSESETSLVWSPLSNLLLYSKTTQVDKALEEGVMVSLGTDWALSGSKSLLDEIKFAWEVNMLNSSALDYQVFDTFTLLKMVTVNPAKSLKWDDKVGVLKENMVADILVLSRPKYTNEIRGLSDDDPYAQVIKATNADVRLVMINGEVVYGDADILLTSDGYNEKINLNNESTKVIKFLSSNQNKTFEQLELELQCALQFDRAYMYKNFNVVNNKKWTRQQFDKWWEQNYSHIKPVTLDPLFTLGDSSFLRQVKEGTGIDLFKYYEKNN